MANIRANAVATVIVSAAIAVGSISATATILQPGKQENKIRLSAVSVEYISSTASVPYVEVSTQRQSDIRAAIEVIPLQPLLPETVYASDTINSLDIGKVIIDIALISESVAISYDKVLADSITVSDVINKAFVSSIDFDMSDPDQDPDPITVVDLSVLDVRKVVSDTVTLDDSNSKVVGTVKSDEISATDIAGPFTVGKNTSDEIIATDTLEKTFTRPNVADSVTSSEVIAKNVGLPWLSDSITTSDQKVLAVGVNTIDTVSASDSIGPYEVGKNVNDTLTIAEEMAKSFTRPNVADAVSVTDVANLDVGITKSDAVTTSDTLGAFAIDAVYLDSVSVSDSIVATLTIGSEPGIVNNTMVNQSIVNG